MNIFGRLFGLVGCPAISVENIMPRHTFRGLYTPVQPAELNLCHRQARSSAVELEVASASRLFHSLAILDHDVAP